MINNKVTQLVLDNLEQKIQEGKFSPNQKNNLAKIEGILTSQLQIKWPKEGNPYYLGFFQLEGLNQDIPTIFKLNSSENWAENKPDLPPRAKILLEGKWAEPSNSNRPSFTCLAYQIITTPPPPTIKSLREQISPLLKTSLDQKTQWTKKTDYLFRKQKDLQELDKLTQLGSKYLKAYLLLKSATYANYQNNLLPHSQDLIHQNHYLAKIQSEIEDIAFQIRAYESKQI